MKHYSITVIIHILLLACLSVGCYLLYQHQLWFSLLLTTLLLVCMGVNLYRLQMKQVSAMRRLIESIQHNDMSQSFLPPFKNKGMQRLSEEITAAVKEFRQKMLEEEIKHQYYENLLNKVDMAVLVTDNAGRIDWHNQAARQLLGNKNTLPEALQEIATNDTQVVRLTQSGNVEEMAVSRTQFVSQGKVQWIISLKNIHTVLERNEMEAWQKLIRVLTHEIMNSITPIISLAETISEREIPQAPTGKEFQVMLQAMQTIHRRSKGLLNFVENYRRLTRIPELVCTQVPVSELFLDLRKLFSDQAICFEVPAPEATLYIDRSLIEQVLINLIKNAHEATNTRKDPKVNIVFQRTITGQPILSVHDNGEGILPEVLDKIFVPFFTTKPNGSGIGLSLCKQIMALHGGSISVHSTPGAGTCFKLTFPTAPITK